LNFYLLLESGYNHLYGKEDKHKMNAGRLATFLICAVQTSQQYTAF
jgi:hypothetical protein